jgi:hypothetical protein
MTTSTLSRRHFLKATALGAGTLALTACAPLAPASGPGASEGETVLAADVELITSGWPVTPMPTDEEIRGDPARAGYAQALESWMDQNPGVTIKSVEVNIWDQQAITTAIAGGTAPTFIYALTVGGWSLAGAQAAFKQGLIADITPYIDQYGLTGKLIESARDIFQTHGTVDGNAYYYPIDSGYNGGIWYRRDLVQELGLNEPRIGWTWADFRTLAGALTSEADGRKGFGGPFWYVGKYLGGHGFDIFSLVPTPETGWNWQRDFSDPYWAQLAEEYRSMMFIDRSIYSDAALGSGTGDYSTAFRDGRTAMTTENILGAFGSRAQEDSVAALAERLGKSYEEVIGFAPLPSGDGYVENGLYLGGVSYSPDTVGDVLSKAVSIVDYMFLGGGWDIQKAGQYAATQDLQAVFNYPFPIDGRREYAGVPGTFADAWGEQTLTDLEAMAALPLMPNRALYLPAESNPGPDNQVIDDLWSTLSYVEDVPSVSAALQAAQETWNQQAGGFNSSITDEQFVTGIKEYYEALDVFWRNAAPTFYDNRFKPWKESVIDPALGG